MSPGRGILQAPGSSHWTRFGIGLYVAHVAYSRNPRLAGVIDRST